MARMQKKHAKTTCCASFRSRSMTGNCLGISFAYTGGKSDCAGTGLTSETLPLVNKYGCLHTSQVFFLLWESHVVKLKDMSVRSREIRQVTGHTSLGGYSGSCLSIYTGERVADLVLQARCRSGKCLGPSRLPLPTSLENPFQIQCSGHRPPCSQCVLGAPVLRKL